MKRNIVYALVVLIFTVAAEAATRNVFFAGGQSNAKAVWASAIASGLQAGYGSSLVMVWTNHSGEAMDRWFTTEPRINYSNDLYNADGTSVLQTQIQAITHAGDEAVFQGFFWFQGESDTHTNLMSYYTSRFTAMMARLKADMGLTNDVRFELAIIDANPSPTYDAELASGGRTRESIEYLRTNQMAMCSVPQGAYVDTRGYTRSDVWHLPTDELTRLGGNMSAAFTNAFGISPPPLEERVIISHSADGAIFLTGSFIDQDLICGATGSPLIQYNGVTFFQLPEKRIDVADLLFTVEQDYGPLPNANLDVWGLGYMPVPAMSSSWMLLADTDTRSLINNNVSSTKIADNFVGAGQAAVAGSAWQLSASQRTNLTAFLNMLYAKGAVPGDYAVIRINPDAALAGTANIRWGGSARTSPDHRTRLIVTLADEPTPSATEGVFKTYSHANDGGIFPTGTSTTTDLISGTGGAPTDWSGVAFFPLPEQPMTAASLALPVASFSGVMPKANIDVWGLGYQSSPALTTAWFCTNDVDARVLLNGVPPVKIADNIVTAGQASVAGNLWQPTEAQSRLLKNFLNGLYNKGAKPGDYAVIRVNMDAPQSPTSCGVRWGGSHQADPNKRSSLSGVYPVTSNYLVNAGFESGSGPSASNWGVSYNNFVGQRTNDASRTGGYAYRVAVGGDQSANTANNLNFYQDVASPDLAGKTVTLTCYARHNSSEPLVTNSVQKVETRLWWMYGGASSGMVTSAESLLPTDPKDTYKSIKVTGTVPAGATAVRAMVIFRTGTDVNPAITSGAAYVDDLRLTVFKPVYPPGTRLLLH